MPCRQCCFVTLVVHSSMRDRSTMRLASILFLFQPVSSALSPPPPNPGGCNILQRTKLRRCLLGIISCGNAGLPELVNVNLPGMCGLYMEFAGGAGCRQ